MEANGHRDHRSSEIAKNEESKHDATSKRGKDAARKQVRSMACTSWCLSMERPSCYKYIEVSRRIIREAWWKVASLISQSISLIVVRLQTQENTVHSKPPCTSLPHSSSRRSCHSSPAHRHQTQRPSGPTASAWTQSSQSVASTKSHWAPT